MPKQEKECKRKELLKVVNSVPEDKLTELKLIVSGFIAACEMLQQPKEAS